MNVLVAAIDVALFVVAVVVLGLEAPYGGYRLAQGMRVYFKFREPWRGGLCPINGLQS